MKKIIILIPVYNDWESVQKVLDEINSIISQMKNFHFKCIIVNDCSTNEQPKINKPKYLHSLKILNMKKNSGHARCNAFGLRYIYSKEIYDYADTSDTYFAKGGMKTKLDAAKLAMNSGVSLVIAKGKSKNPIKKLLDGGKSTWFLPSDDVKTARKQWILSTKAKASSSLKDKPVFSKFLT